MGRYRDVLYQLLSGVRSWVYRDILYQLLSGVRSWVGIEISSISCYHDIRSRVGLEISSINCYLVSGHG